MRRFIDKTRGRHVSLVVSFFHVALLCAHIDSSLGVLLLLLLSFGGLSAHQIGHGNIFADSDCKSITQGCSTDLLALEAGYLGRQRPCVKVAMAKLAIEVWTPGVDCSSSIDGSGKATLLLADLNVGEVNTIHAHFLRRAKNAKLSRTPNNQLLQVSDRR